MRLKLGVLLLGSVIFSHVVSFEALADESIKLKATDAKTISAPYDVQFLDTMTEHHREGIKMMQLAVDKSKDSNIQQMAQKGINDQTKDIEELTALREKVNADAPDAMNPKLPGMMPKDKMAKSLAKLKDSKGKNFDKDYLQTMIQHHQGAVKMSEQAVTKAKNPDVQTKAKEMHDKQNSEIAEMQNMIREMN